jgi:hypothetical protein
MQTVGCLLPMLALLSLCSSARAQSTLQQEAEEGWEPVVALSYSLTLPAQSTRRVFDELSFVGFEYSMFVPLWGRFYLGVTASYNEFEDNDGRRTYQTQNGAVTGTFYRSASLAALTFAGRYYLGGPRWVLRPFLGGRVGVSFADVSFSIVDRNTSRALVGLQLAPEVGLGLRIAGGFGLVASYQYVYTTSSLDLIDNLSYHCVNVGPQLRY